VLHSCFLFKLALFFFTLFLVNPVLFSVSFKAVYVFVAGFSNVYRLELSAFMVISFYYCPLNIATLIPTH
jgi:hypothetical protein